MTLQETSVNQELANLDLTKVCALQQKRTLAFVHHFVVTTAQFLNNFMKKCEYKLMLFERKLEKVEAAMVLLEARLSSIPEVNTEPEPKPQETPPTATEEVATELTQEQNVSTTEVVANPESSVPEPLHPEYDRFVKMIQVGVPLEAVKLKVSLEGLDPNTLVKIIGK